MSRSSSFIPRTHPFMLHAENLICLRGAAPLFAPVGFSGAAGSALFLEGPNGSGKSTLLRTLAGLFKQYRGQFSLSGPCLYLGHASALQPLLTVTEHLAYWRSLVPLPCAHQPQSILETLGLATLAQERVNVLSQGQRRRISLARLLQSDAPVWLLDEPHAALDAHSLGILQNMISRKREAGGCVIIASHGGLNLPGAATLALKACHA